jgi:hypothetical protein
MAATDVTDTLQVALQVSGLDQVKVLHRPRLLSDNGSILRIERARRVAREQRHQTHPRSS